MSIKEIKSRLTVLTVLSYYGLKPNKNNMLSCPFHDDKKASMKIYPETNTAYCFAGSCKVESLDVIDFIMRMEKCTKHEAIQKAKQLITGQSAEPIHPITVSMPIVKQEERNKAFNRYIKSLATHHEAKAYCEKRGLDWKTIEVGYKSRKTKEVWGRGCIILPLKDEFGNIVNFYGRSIFGDGHYYEKNRRGLYPAYPDQTTRCLILSESILDGASLGQLEGVSSYGLLSLFGTNGLTVEHKEAIAGLEKLEEIILMLDGDEAGGKAMGEHAKTLSVLRPSVKISQVDLPSGEDINSLYVGHEDVEGLFKGLIDNRKVVIQEVKPKPIPKPALDAINKYKLQFTGIAGMYQVKGFDPGRHADSQLDSLKITLQITKS